MCSSLQGRTRSAGGPTVEPSIGLFSTAKLRDFSEAAPAMNDPILPLPGLSPAGGNPVMVKFDGGLLSSDGGVLALREVERCLGVVSDDLPICHPARRAARWFTPRTWLPRQYF